MKELPEAAKAKLAEVERLTAEIVELEDRLGIDPTHKRDNNVGLYQQRLALYSQLRAANVSYPAIGRAARTSGESVRAAIHKKRIRLIPQPDPIPDP